MYRTTGRGFEYLGRFHILNKLGGYIFEKIDKGPLNVLPEITSFGWNVYDSLCEILVRCQTGLNRNALFSYLDPEDRRLLDLAVDTGLLLQVKKGKSSQYKTSQLGIGFVRDVASARGKLMKFLNYETQNP